MSKTSKPTGRAIEDEKGNRSWKWAGEDNMDTARVRSLGEELSLETPAPNEVQAALDPYNQNTPSSQRHSRNAPPPPPPPPEKPVKRRTLDDMRRLSEQIKRTKNWKRED